MDLKDIFYFCLVVVALLAISWGVKKLQKLRYVKQHKQLQVVLSFIDTAATDIAQQMLAEPTPAGRAQLKKALMDNTVKEIKTQLPKALAAAKVDDVKVAELVSDKITQRLSDTKTT